MSRKLVTKLCLIVFVLALAVSIRALAFTGPSSASGVGGGAISTDGSNNVGIGVSANSSIRLQVEGADTSGSKFGLKVLDSGSNPTFTVRNDGVVIIASTTWVAASGIKFSDNSVISSANGLGGGATTTPAALISSVGGSFGSLTGGGNYSFSAGLTADSPTFVVDSVNHRVGIGTTGPGQKLEVGGNTSSTQFCLGGSCIASWPSTGTNNWTLSGTSLYPTSTAYELGVGTASVDTNYAITTAGGGIKAVSGAQPAGYFSSASGYALLTGTGNVGIGTYAPGEKLEVSGGNINIPYQANKTNGYKLGLGNDVGYIWRNYAYADDAMYMSQNWYSNDAGTGVIPNAGHATEAIKLFRDGSISLMTGSTNVVPSSRLLVNSTGNVGIGTTGPGQKLEVAGNTSSTQFCLGGSCIASWPSTGTNNWTLSGTSLYPTSTTYELGVGTASVDTNYAITTAGGGIKAVSGAQPAGYFSSASGYALLTGTGNVGIGLMPSVIFETNGTARFDRPGSPSQYAEILSDALGSRIRGVSPQTNMKQMGVYASYVAGGTPSGANMLVLGTGAVGSESSSLVIGPTGGVSVGASYQFSDAGNGHLLVESNLGIGTTNPLEKLHVVGNIRNSALAGTGNRCVYANSNGNLAVETSDCGVAGTGNTVDTLSATLGAGNDAGTQNIINLGTVSATSFTGAGTGLTGTAASLTAGAVTNFTSEVNRSDGNNYSLAARGTGIYAIAGAGTNGPGTTYLDLIHAANGTDVAFQIAGGYTSDNMYFRGTSALQSGTGYTSWRTVLHSGNVGTYALPIGGGTLTGALTVNGLIYSTAAGIKFPDGTTQTTAASAGGVFSFNTRTGAVTLSSADVTGALTFTPYNSTNPSGYITAGVASLTAATVTFGGGTGKITIGTVDPPYTIGGKQYATYLPGMTGQKEETTGLAKLTCSKNQCERKIAFGSEQEGSDLWLFAKTTDLKNHMADMTVLLSPTFDGKVWYKKDASASTLTILASGDGLTDGAEVSYHLIAPRFDSENWPNTRNEPGVEGLKIAN